MRNGWDYGDYFMDEKGSLQVRVSEFANPDDAVYIAVHEVMEAWRYAKKHGADFSAIDEFDLAHQETDEPGRLKCAPYHQEHKLSEQIERLLCNQDNMEWQDHYNAEPIRKEKQP
jgi:hypothetical protein